MGKKPESEDATLGSKRPRFPELRVEERKLGDRSAIRVLNLRSSWKRPFMRCTGSKKVSRCDIVFPFPDAKHLEKSKVYFAMDICRGHHCIIEWRWLGLTKANRRARIHRGNLIS